MGEILFHLFISDLMDLFNPGLARIVALILNDVHIWVQFGHLGCLWTFCLFENM